MNTLPCCWIVFFYHFFYFLKQLTTCAEYQLVSKVDVVTLNFINSKRVESRANFQIIEENLNIFQNSKLKSNYCILRTRTAQLDKLLQNTINAKISKALEFNVQILHLSNSMSRDSNYHNFLHHFIATPL